MRPDRRRAVLRSGLPPLLLAGTLMVLGHPRQGSVLFAVACVLAVLSFVWPTQGEHAFHAITHVVTVTIGAVLLGLVECLVVIPAWIVVRIAGHDPLASNPSFGTAHSPSPARPYAREPKVSLRRPTMLRGAIGMLLVGSAAVLATIAVARVVFPPTIELRVGGFPYRPYSHEHEPWAHQLFDEEALQPRVPDAVLGYRFIDYRTSYVNVRSLARASWTPRDPAIEVWFFGGSTMFGIGQRDDHTIPSEVAHLAAAHGQRVRVLNFGAQGYTAWQEAALFRRLLSTGRRRPAIAVFYHGANDLSLTCSKMKQGFPFAKDITMTAVAHEHGSLPPQECARVPDLTGRATAAALHRAMTDVRAAAGDIKVVEYLQPTPATKKLAPADGPLFPVINWTPSWIAIQHHMFATLLKADSPPPVDLTHALDSVTVPVFFDYTHTNELGARVIAAAIYEDLQRSLG